MLMKCKTCELEFTPPRKHILNCPKCIDFRKVKNTPEGTIKEASESEQNDDDEERESDEQNEVEEKSKYREHQQLKKKQLSNCEMICGSIIIYDNNSSNKDTSIKQYISMINDEMNNLLNQSKLYVDAIQLDTQSTITDNVRIVHDRLKKLNKNINTTSDNGEILNMSKLIKTKVDLNSIQWSELKNTLI